MHKTDKSTLMEVFYWLYYKRIHRWMKAKCVLLNKDAQETISLSSPKV